MKNHLLRHLATTHGLTNNVRCDSSSPRPAMKTRAAFCLQTTPLTRVSRQLCATTLKIRSAARQPFSPLNIGLIKQTCKYDFIVYSLLSPMPQSVEMYFTNKILICYKIYIVIKYIL